MPRCDYRFEGGRDLAEFKVVASGLPGSAWTSSYELEMETLRPIGAEIVVVDAGSNEEYVAQAKDADAIIAGQSKPARQHKRWLRGLPPREVHPKPPSITSVRDILHLPNYRSIAETYDLTGVPLAKQPDPHGMYAHGRSPLPCSCHPETRALPSHSTDTINLSPLWRRALERALGIPVPTTLPA